MPKAVRKHRAQQASDFGGKAAKGTPFFFVSITENAPSARVLLSNTEYPVVLPGLPKECAL